MPVNYNTYYSIQANNLLMNKEFISKKACVQPKNTTQSGSDFQEESEPDVFTSLTFGGIMAIASYSGIERADAGQWTSKTLTAII